PCGPPGQDPGKTNGWWLLTDKADSVHEPYTAPFTRGDHLTNSRFPPLLRHNNHNLEKRRAKVFIQKTGEKIIWMRASPGRGGVLKKVRRCQHRGVRIMAIVILNEFIHFRHDGLDAFRAARQQDVEHLREPPVHGVELMQALHLGEVPGRFEDPGPSHLVAA